MKELNVDFEAIESVISCKHIYGKMFLRGFIYNNINKVHKRSFFFCKKQVSFCGVFIITGFFWLLFVLLFGILYDNIVQSTTKNWFPVVLLFPFLLFLPILVFLWIIRRNLIRLLKSYTDSSFNPDIKNRNDVLSNTVYKAILRSYVFPEDAPLEAWKWKQTKLLVFFMESPLLVEIVWDVLINRFKMQPEDAMQIAMKLQEEPAWKTIDEFVILLSKHLDSSNIRPVLSLGEIS